MSGLSSANLITAARVGLREAAASIWSDAEMTSWCAQVAREISRKVGLPKRANLSIIEYTKDVDLGSLSYIDLLRVEYPIGNDSYEPIWRGYTQFGSTLTLDIDAVPTITDGTLTGTVTWAPNYRTVTGSGTLFTEELTEGYLIQVGKVADAAYKWYSIAEIVDDTHLTLNEIFEESTTADTVSLTKYRDSNSCVRVYYTADYTVSTTSDMPAQYDEIAILGIVAHAATEYASNYAQVKLTDVTSKLSSASTSAGNISARITQAVADLTSGRTNLVTEWAAYSLVLNDVETALDAIDTDLASARTNVAVTSAGGNLSAKYTETARTLVQETQQRIDKARSHLDAAKTNHDYIDIAAQELSGAASYANQAQSYITQAEQSINVSGLVRQYQTWANMKYQEYQVALNRIGRFSDKVIYPGVRAL